jgi:predicted RecA/RadA family phage recombinase
MIATYVQDDDYIDYTPGADVAAGAVVVQGDLIGVALRPIPANTLGALAVEGVFDVPKASGASTAIAAGVNVYWNAGAQQATTTASGNKLLGKTTKAAVDADTTVRVRLLQ